MVECKIIQRENLTFKEEKLVKNVCVCEGSKVKGLVPTRGHGEGGAGGPQRRHGVGYPGWIHTHCCSGETWKTHTHTTGSTDSQ